MDLNLHIWWILAVVWALDIAWRRLQPYRPSHIPKWLASPKAAYYIVYGRFVQLAVTVSFVFVVPFLPFRLFWLFPVWAFVTHLIFIHLTSAAGAAHKQIKATDQPGGAVPGIESRLDLCGGDAVEPDRT